MKRQKCPKCEIGRLRKRTSREKGAIEIWYRECSKRCGYHDSIKVQPAKIIGLPTVRTPEIISDQFLDGTTTARIQQT
jgi:hypothetical protein